MALKQLPSKWSKKEILGHLIYSATAFKTRKALIERDYGFEK
jgi:hypothetical protein